MKTIAILFALSCAAFGQQAILNQYGFPSTVGRTPTWPFDTYQITGLNPFTYREYDSSVQTDPYVFVLNDRMLSTPVYPSSIVLPLGVSVDYEYLGGSLNRGTVWLPGSSFVWLGADAWYYEFPEYPAPVSTLNILNWSFHFVVFDAFTLPRFFSTPMISGF